MITKNQISVLVVVITLLAIPLIGMQFSSEINWSISDFIIMGALLSIVGFTLEFIYRKTPDKIFKFSLIALVLLFFMLIWAELAVGIFNSPFAGS